MSDTRDPATSYDPGPDFWNDFVRRYWGRRPTVIRQPFARSIASPAEIFAAMIAATDRLRTDDLDFILAIDGIRAGAEDVEICLPTRKDRSMERLADRIGGHLPGGSFAIFVRDVQLELGWEFWKRIRSFLTGLYALVGVPAHRANVDLFAGSYERSRRGIHLDSADVFCFVIEGRKRIRVWPRSSFPGQHYWYGLGGEPKLEKSRCLDGEPGDILYWPSSYWHIGESLGGTVSSLSLGLYPQDSLAARTARVVEEEAAHELGADNVIESLPSSVEQLEAAPPRALRAIARASENLALALLRRRMEQVTGCAFERIPLPSARRRIRASSTFTSDPAFPIFRRAVGGTAIIAANGRSITLPQSKALEGMIDALNRGASISLSQGRRGVDSQLREAVRFLLFSGAVETRPRRALEAFRERRLGRVRF
jgi:hypothetical protein